jgi:hypothetical protein
MKSILCQLNVKVPVLQILVYIVLCAHLSSNFLIQFAKLVRAREKLPCVISVGLGQVSFCFILFLCLCNHSYYLYISFWHLWDVHKVDIISNSCLGLKLLLNIIPIDCSS